MVIPLTLEALILRKKNKRKTMMNNIKNTMCRLSKLTQEQINSIKSIAPDDGFLDFYVEEINIGFSENGNFGTWESHNDLTIVTYTEMMQLLGKDMNKQTAQEQIAVMQIEMDKLKAIIDKPEVKTGRVLSADDLRMGATYWVGYYSVSSSIFMADNSDISRIEAGFTFHDKESAERHLEYLKLEQELRIAQAVGGEGQSVICFRYGGVVCDDHIVSHHKISFNNRDARNKFRATHTDEQLTLLIRGV